VVARCLLDVNVLIALAWPSHLHHGEAHEWFQKHRRQGFATCPLTQLGFLRLSMNPKFTKDAVSASTAMALLNRITGLKEHSFWPDSLGCKEALVSDQLIVGHQQLTGYYLVGMARSRGAVLATFDRAIPVSGVFRKFVELIGAVR
jgi:toxin-antitoxin system PIN domain toxin